MKKLVLLASGTLAFLAATTAGFAQSGWTSPCSTSATIEEVSVDLYRLLGASLLHRVDALGNVRARYNVTNTSSPSTPTPPWTTFELGYLDTGGGFVHAGLFKVNICTGGIAKLAEITSVDAGRGTCLQVQFPADTFNFLTNLYYVQVDVFRDSVDQEVRANTLRIF